MAFHPVENTRPACYAWTMSQNDTPDDMPMPAATAATGATGSVQAVTRALDLLRILAETPGGIGLSPAARKAGLAASTTHRLLNTLAARGLNVPR